MVRGSALRRLRTFLFVGVIVMRVTFCGHSTVYDKEEAEERLYFQIEKLIQKGADEFLFGGYGEFDLLSARTVKKLKKKYAHIKSILVIPYMDMEYNKELYDASEYPPIENVPPRFAIIKRNEYMISIADVVVAYIIHTVGGAWRTYCYATRRGKEIINLYE